MKGWANYLVNNTNPIPTTEYVIPGLCSPCLTHAHTRLTHDGLKRQSSNLELKGIVAIKAMSLISSSAQQFLDAQHFSVCRSHCYRTEMTA